MKAFHVIAFAAAAMVSSLALAAAPVLKVSKHATVDADVDKTWATIKDFGGLDKWHPALESDKIVAGNAMTQPGLIAETQKAFSQTLGQELAQQFVAAVRSDVKVKRNEDDIKAAQARITGPTATE